MKNITTKVIFKGLALVAFTFFGTQVIAQEKGQKPPTYAALLEKMDTNKDGKLAKSEVKGPLADNFDTIDADGDGYLSETEFDNAPRPKRKGKKAE